VLISEQLLAVPARSEARNIFGRSNTGVVGSNAIRGMDVYMYVYVYSMSVFSYVGEGLSMS
jgi:hypothetical protein